MSACEVACERIWNGGEGVREGEAPLCVPDDEVSM